MGKSIMPYSLGCPSGPFLIAPHSRKPKLWASLALAAASLFIILTLGVIYGDQWRASDVAITAFAYKVRTQEWTQFMLLVTTLNSNLAINIYSGLIILYLLSRRAWRPAMWFFWIVQGGLLLNVLVKHVVSRARPSAFDPLLHLSSYSFPSGHVTGTVLFYGALVFAYTQTAPRQRAVFASIVLAISFILLTGLSRLYLGVHFLSDVLGGAALGLTWLTLHLWYWSCSAGTRPPAPVAADRS